MGVVQNIEGVGRVGNVEGVGGSIYVHPLVYLYANELYSSTIQSIHLDEDFLSRAHR